MRAPVSERRLPRLTPVMQFALEAIVAHGGKLVRLPGGYWTWPDCPRRAHDGVPEFFAGATTVTALVRRGRLTYTAWKEGRQWRFPVAAEVAGAWAQVRDAIVQAQSEA